MSMNNGILSIPGMVSGLPTQSIIQELVAARQATETPLMNQQKAINNQIQAWNGVTPLLSDLQNAVQTLVNPSTWNAMTASSSNSTAISVTANAGATAGTYTLQSNQLAQGQTDASVNLSPTNVGTAGSFKIVQNGVTATVNVNNGDSLQTIASAINTSSQTAGLNVSASVFTNADGTAKLMISSTKTGQQSAFTVSDVSGTFVQSTLQLGQTMAAQDAQAQVNGVTVTSSTDAFSNVVGGLNFTLNQGGGATSTVTVASDTTKVTDAVNGFISSYNALVQNLQSISKIDTSSSGNNGPLAGDNSVQSLLISLESSVGNLIPNSGTYGGLGAIGIVLNSDGTLAFDSTGANNGGPGGLDGKTIFQNALTTDPTDLQKLFGTVSLDGLAPTTGLGGLLINMNSTSQGIVTAASDPVNGVVTTEVSSLNTQYSTLQDQIKQINDASTQYQNQLQAQFNAMETQISLYKSQQQWLNQFGGMSTSSSNSSSSGSSSGM